MRIALTGSSGLVGSALTPELTARGHNVIEIRRDDVSWDPEHGIAAPQLFAQCDAVIHLAGATVGRYWTKTYKERIRDSRVLGTRAVADALASLDRRPRVLLSASAIGYYGDRGDEILSERSSPGTGFRADLCREWEAATEGASAAGVRVVLLRSGNVLTQIGGILPYLTAARRLRVVPRFGRDQFWSCISLRDEVDAIIHLLGSDLDGPVNLTCPDPIRFRRLAELLARRPRSVVFPLPKPILRMIVGRERADEVVLSSQRGIPERLIASGYEFHDSDLQSILETAESVTCQ